MKFEVTETCFGNKIYFNDVELNDNKLSEEELVDYLRKLSIILINRCSYGTLINFIEEAVIDDKDTKWESLDYCETCGSNPYKYTLEI